MDYSTNSPQGNFSGELKLTGQTTAVCNIYDMAGNCAEMTTEMHDYPPYTYRGGSCVNGTSACHRFPSTGEALQNVSFRVAMYCK